MYMYIIFSHIIHTNYQVNVLLPMKPSTIRFELEMAQYGIVGEIIGADSISVLLTGCELF